MNIAILEKTMENLRNRFNVQLVKFTSEPSYMLHKIFDSSLIAIRKSKLALKLNKRTYI